MYIRVSTDMQNRGMDVQLNDCNRYIVENRLTLKEIITDEDYSGSSHFDERPGLSLLIKKLQRNDILLVSHRDRLGRAVPVIGRIEYEVIEKRGARIISVANEGTHDNNTFFTRIIDAFSEHERERIRQRIKAAMQQKLRNQEYTGTVPIGYQLSVDGKRLEISSEEKKLITYIRTLHTRGYSIRQIALYLNNKNVLNRGKKWSHQSIFRRLHV